MWRSLRLPIASGQNADDVVIKVDTRLVVLHATVVDKNGRLVTTLSQSAFQVYENGAQQQLKRNRPVSAV